MNTENLTNQPDWMLKAIIQKNDRLMTGRYGLALACSIPLLYQTYQHQFLLTEDSYLTELQWRSEN